MSVNMDTIAANVDRARYKYGLCKELVSGFCSTLDPEDRLIVSDIWSFFLDMAETAESVARAAGYEGEGIY